MKNKRLVKFWTKYIASYILPLAISSFMAWIFIYASYQISERSAALTIGVLGGFFGGFTYWILIAVLTLAFKRYSRYLSPKVKHLLRIRGY